MAVKFKDYYETLGLSRDADAAKIKRAYRKLAREYHPDVNRSATAETKFKEIAEAYEVLADPEKRKRYDQLGANWKTGQDFNARPEPPPSGGQQWGGAGQRPRSYSFNDMGGGFSDFFESLFGQASGGRNPRQEAGGWKIPTRGQDHETEIDIPLEDAFHGTARSMTLKLQEMAPDGSLRENSRQVDFRIPPGAVNGTRLRLAGQGGPGYDGGEPGDLFLRIKITPHPVFHLKGHHLELDLDITPWEAALGGTIPVPTLEGKSSVRLKPGTQSGQKLRLKEKGMPSKHGQGDLYATIQIKVPEKLGEKERELFEALAKTSTFNPRS